MKIAAYNVENLFDRAKAFNEESAEAQRVVKEEAELNALLEKPEYTPATKKRILVLLKSLGILKVEYFSIYNGLAINFLFAFRNDGTALGYRVQNQMNSIIPWLAKDTKFEPVQEVYYSLLLSQFLIPILHVRF